MLEWLAEDKNIMRGWNQIFPNDKIMWDNPPLDGNLVLHKVLKVPIPSIKDRHAFLILYWEWVSDTELLFLSTSENMESYIEENKKLIKGGVIDHYFANHCSLKLDLDGGCY